MPKVRPPRDPNAPLGPIRLRPRSPRGKVRLREQYTPAGRISRHERCAVTLLGPPKPSGAKMLASPFHRALRARGHLREAARLTGSTVEEIALRLGIEINTANDDTWPCLRRLVTDFD